MLVVDSTNARHKVSYMLHYFFFSTHIHHPPLPRSLICSQDQVQLIIVYTFGSIARDGASNVLL